MAQFPYPCLVADVGGTNARFAVLMEPGGKLSAMVKLSTGDEADFALTVEKALREAGFPRPQSFLLAVAGPLSGRSAALTNAKTGEGALAIDGPKLADALGLEQGLLLNDFEALCLSLPFLGTHDVSPLTKGKAVAGEPMLVVGPGTGLGVGALIQTEGRWLPVASEGGHVDMGPRTADEFQLWPHLGSDPVSAEDLLSGRGLVRLHGAVRRQIGFPPVETDAAGVTALMLSGDKAAGTAARHFLALLARFAGDMALVFCARGGVFVGGGITPRLQPRLEPAVFARRFADKGKVGGYLADIPVNMVIAPDAALQGLAAVAAEPEAFALNYAERNWR